MVAGVAEHRLDRARRRSRLSDRRALLLEDGRSLFTPVIGMVGGVAAVPLPFTNGSRSGSTHWKSSWPSGNGASGQRRRVTGARTAKRIRSRAASGGSGRSDFAAIADNLEFIMAQVSKVPTQRELAWVAAGSFVGSAPLATLATLILVH
jgi:hypothetical protein